MNREELARRRSNAAGILAVIWMIVIFIFSAQNNEESSVVSEGFSDQIVSVTGWLLHLHIDENKVLEIALAIEYFVRKGAHMTEYAILAVLLYLWIGRWRMARSHRYCLAAALAIVYACSDEFHQLFVEGRAGLISDVLVDGAGAILGLALFLLMRRGIAWLVGKRRP